MDLSGNGGQQQSSESKPLPAGRGNVAVGDEGALLGSGVTFDFWGRMQIDPTVNFVLLGVECHTALL